MRKSIIITRIFTIFAVVGLLGGFAYHVFAAIPLGSNFQLNSQLPLDARSVATTITTRNAISSGARYEGMVVYVVDSDGSGNPATYQLQNGITNSDWVEFGSGVGSGTVTSVSVSTANGVSGSVSNNTTTPAITLTLGAITPSSVNGLTLTAGGTGFSIAGGTSSKTLTVSNTLTLAGTDSSTLNIGAGGTLGTGAFAALGATRALDNLASVAINTSLVSDTDNTDALGSALIGWSDLFLGDGAVVNFNNGDVTVTHSLNAVTLAGGSLVLPNAGLTVGSSVPFSDASGTLTLQNVDDLDPTTEGTIEGAIDTLANLTSIQGQTVTLAGNLVTAGSFTTAGAFALTLTSTATTNVTLPTSGTLATLAGSEALTNKTVNGLTVTSSNGTLTVANGSTLATSGANSLTLTTTGSTNVTLPTSGTLYGTATGSITSSQLATSLTDETGSGLAVFDTTPTFTTNITAPLVIGGTGTTSTLTFKTTSGVGTTNADMIFQVGNNGATEAMRILNSGSVGIGTASPSSKLDITTNGITAGTQSNDTGLSLVNLGTASNTAQQVSPALRFHGSGWRSSPTGATVDFDFRTSLIPVKTLATSPTAYLNFGSSVNGGAYTDGQFIINTLGNIGVGTLAPHGLIDITQSVTGIGTVSTSGNTVTGIHTNFPNTFKIGDTITVGGETQTISGINGDTLTTIGTWAGTFSNASYTVNSSGSRFVVQGNGRVGIGTTTPTTIFEIGSSDMGDASAGPIMTLGRNSNLTNTGAGSIDFLRKDGTHGYVWQDNTGLMRISTSAPTNADDTSGTIIGAQSSSLSSKNLIGEFTDYSHALDTIVNAPLYDFTYKSGAFNNQQFTGIIIDYTPEFGMDRDAGHPAGKSLNTITGLGYTFGAIKELNTKVESLNLSVAGLTSIDDTQSGSLGSLMKEFLLQAVVVINDLKEATVGLLNINGDVCVEDDIEKVCLPKDKFKELLRNAGGVVTEKNKSPAVVPTSNPEPNTLGTVPNTPADETPTPPESTPVEESPAENPDTAPETPSEENLPSPDTPTEPQI